MPVARVTISVEGNQTGEAAVGKVGAKNRGLGGKDLRKRATEAIIFTLKEQNINPSDIAFNFLIVPLRESEMA